MTKIEKEIKIMNLLTQVAGLNYEIDNYFDTESDKMLDDKIEVLTALKNGKTIGEIPKFYKILELMPKNGDIWD